MNETQVQEITNATNNAALALLSWNQGFMLVALGCLFMLVVLVVLNLRRH